MTAPTVNRWFINDDFAPEVTAPQHHRYIVVPQDRDGDTVSRVGGLNFRDEKFATAALARAAFEEALARDGRENYPPVTAQIFYHVATGAIPKPTPEAFFWS
jgi:hypothetical protein